MANNDNKQLQREMKRLLKMADCKVKAVADRLVEDKANKYANNLRGAVYTASGPYYHYSMKGRIKLPAGTLAKQIYVYETKEGEYKISFYNNERLGYLGNVAYLLEYGFYDFTGKGFFRKTFKNAQNDFKRSLVKEISRIGIELNK